MGPPLPAAAGKVIYDVHAIGIRFVVAVNCCHLVYCGCWFKARLLGGIGNRQERSLVRFADTWIVLYLVLNWLANLLPWVR